MSNARQRKGTLSRLAAVSVGADALRDAADALSAVERTSAIVGRSNQYLIGTMGAAIGSLPGIYLYYLGTGTIVSMAISAALSVVLASVCVLTYRMRVRRSLPVLLEDIDRESAKLLDAYRDAATSRIPKEMREVLMSQYLTVVRRRGELLALAYGGSEQKAIRFVATERRTPSKRTPDEEHNIEAKAEDEAAAIEGDALRRGRTSSAKH